MHFMHELATVVAVNPTVLVLLKLRDMNLLTVEAIE